MAIYTNSTLTNTIPQIWDTTLLEARYAEGVIQQRVLNKSQILADKGSLVYIDVEPNYTTSAGTVDPSDGGFTPVNTAPTQVNITVDTWDYVAVELTKQADVQSFWDPTSKFPNRAGKVQAIRIDTALANLYTGVAAGNTIGDDNNPDAFGHADMRLGLLRLADSNIPTDSLSLILPPIGWYTGLLSDVNLTAAYATGLPKSVLTTGFKQELLGTPVYLSTVLASSALSRKGLLLHKEALGVAIQINADYRLADRTSALKLSKVGVMNWLYGVRTIRSDHFIVFNIKKT